MPRITISVPDELKKRLDKFPEVNWAEVIRGILRSNVNKLLEFEKKGGK